MLKELRNKTLPDSRLGAWVRALLETRAQTKVQSEVMWVVSPLKYKIEDQVLDQLWGQLLATCVPDWRYISVD